MSRSMKYSSLLLIAAWSLACSRSDEPNKASGMSSKATAAGDLAPSDTTPPRNLAGTRWRLVEIQSLKNPKGTRPADPRKYLMSFDSEGGIVVVQLDCHRARGTYADTRNPDRRGGSLTISSLALTPAQCPQPVLGDRIMKDLGSVRAYRVASGELYLDGLPDGSTYVWQRTEVPQ